jgi:putative membrane protein
MTIKNFSDHAANERTFLAWVRTAIAVMAFGFLVEKFGLFLELAGVTMGTRVQGFVTPHFSEVAGVALIVLGIIIVAVAALRLVKTAKQIDDETRHPGPGSRVDVTLAVLILLLGVAMLVYLTPNLLQSL